LLESLNARSGEGAPRRAGEFYREVIFPPGRLIMLQLYSPLQHGIQDASHPGTRPPAGVQFNVFDVNLPGQSKPATQ
jgi:hypothetical protein